MTCVNVNISGFNFNVKTSKKQASKYSGYSYDVKIIVSQKNLKESVHSVRLIVIVVTAILAILSLFGSSSSSSSSIQSWFCFFIWSYLENSSSTLLKPRTERMVQSSWSNKRAWSKHSSMRPATGFNKWCDINTLRELASKQLTKFPPKNRGIDHHQWHIPQSAAVQIQNFGWEKSTTHESWKCCPTRFKNWAFRPILNLLQALKHLFMFCGVFGLHLGLFCYTCEVFVGCIPIWETTSPPKENWKNGLRESNCHWLNLESSRQRWSNKLTNKSGQAKKQLRVAQEVVHFALSSFDHLGRWVYILQGRSTHDWGMIILPKQNAWHPIFWITYHDSTTGNKGIPSLNSFTSHPFWWGWVRSS